MKIFAGQRDDPFWVDLGGIFDLLTIRKLPGNAGGGIDDLQGLNVQSIAIQVPIADLTATGAAPTGPTDDNAIIGVWSTTTAAPPRSSMPMARARRRRVRPGFAPRHAAGQRSRCSNRCQGSLQRLAAEG